MTGEISFNNVSLQTSTIKVNGIDHMSGPARNIEMLAIANANASAIPDSDYPSKIIRVRGFVRPLVAHPTLEETFLDLNVDYFKKLLSGKEKNLDINFGGDTRRYIATAGTPQLGEATGTKLWVPFTVEFYCTEPFGMDVAATPLFTVSGNTAATVTQTPSVDGSAPAQLPKFTITINTFSGASGYVQLTDNVNNQSMIIIGQGFSNGDVIVIDSETRIVTFNNVEIDYTGVFLEFEPGSQSITYSDGFSSRDVDIEAEYKKRYF